MEFQSSTASPATTISNRHCRPHLRLEQLNARDRMPVVRQITLQRAHALERTGRCRDVSGMPRSLMVSSEMIPSVPSADKQMRRRSGEGFLPGAVV